MIIDKVADFARTNQSSKELLKKYIDLRSRPVDNLIELSKLSAELCKIQEKLINQYILSFNGNEEAILADVKEILSKIEKKDFTDEIVIRKRLLPSKENIEKAKEESNAREVILYIKKAEQEAKANYKNFYDWILLNALKHQLKALLHYKLPTDKLEALAAEKAESFYKKPKNLSPIDSNAISVNPLKYTNALYSTIRQGTATNAFTKIRAEKISENYIDKITGDATIEEKQCTVIIPKHSVFKGLKTSAQQLLDIITIHLTESGAKSPSVEFTLDEYMQRRGLKDRKAAREQVKSDLQVLRGISIQWEEKRGKKTEMYGFMNIADSGELKRNGVITFTFGNSFFNMLKSYPVMAYPAQLQKLNNKRNPNSYYLGRKICEHKRMNAGDHNENIISVKTLLNVACYIPSYEEVMQGNRNLSERIIDPFERDMDALKDIFGWDYCRKNGEILSDEERQAVYNYDFFKTLNILIKWSNEYPKPQTLIDAKENRKEEARKQRQEKSNNRKPRTKKKVTNT